MGAETQRIGHLFVRFGVLDDEKLRRCLDRLRQLRSEGKAASLAEIAVELGWATSEQVRQIVGPEGPATLRCRQCGRRYAVPQFQSSRKYRCGDCKAYLVFDASEVRKDEAPAKPPEKKDPFQDRRFGAHRLLRLVGKGGMGAVYEAEHVDTKARAAVKILAEEFAKIPDVAKRFKREAVAGGKLNHPNIVEIYDIDRQDNFNYIVSEFVEGMSLEKLILKEKRLAPDRAVRILRQVLAGLQHAHEHGIVHRDIKPGNVLLTPDEQAKLIDFGIAKDEEARTVLTLAGTVLGSPSYMSPEQAQGEEITAATDLYSCGVLLFVMLTGRKPFEGKNLVETLSMHVKQPVPSLRAIRLEIPEALERVVYRMMAKKPQDRYATPAAAIVALDRAMGKAPPARDLRRVPWWVWAAGAVGVGGVVLWLLLR